jgi:hypothetical protein
MNLNGIFFERTSYWTYSASRRQDTLEVSDAFKNK